MSTPLQSDTARAPTFLFAGGGSGGHLYPGIAVAESLQKLCADVQIRFVASARQIDRDILATTPFECVVQPVRPIPSRPWLLPQFLLSWYRSMTLANQLLQRYQPNAVLGMGGFAAGPLVRAAAKMGIPTALLNPDSVPGKANRYLAKIVDRIFLQWPTDQLPAEKCVVSGCPVRQSIVSADSGIVFDLYRLDKSKMTLLVTGASQGSASINRTIVACLSTISEFADRWQVLHLAGTSSDQEVRGAYQQANPRISWTVLGYENRMGELLAAADLVISRAGASSVAEFMATGKVCILFPYPYHRDNHQSVNASHCAAAGSAIVLEDLLDQAGNAAQLRPALKKLMGDGQTYERMAAAARRICNLHSANTVAQYLLSASALQR